MTDWADEITNDIWRDKRNPNKSHWTYEAAQALREAVAAETERWETYLAEIYADGGLNSVAKICDEQIDKTGGLLGRVRKKAAAIRETPK